MKNYSKKIFLGVDIGGSNIKFVVVEHRKKGRIKILHENSLKTPHDRNKLTQLIVHEIKRLEVTCSSSFPELRQLPKQLPKSNRPTFLCLRLLAAIATLEQLLKITKGIFCAFFYYLLSPLID